jgi:hypothetical protein
VVIILSGTGFHADDESAAEVTGNEAMRLTSRNDKRLIFMDFLNDFKWN